MGENFRNFPVSMQCGKIKNLPPTENFFRQINYLAISLLKTGKTVTFTKFWLKKCESNSLCNFHSVVIAFYSTFTHFSSNRSTSYLVFSLVKTLLSRNFYQRIVTLNFSNLHTHSHCGNTEMLVSLIFNKNSMKLTFSQKSFIIN